MERRERIMEAVVAALDAPSVTIRGVEYPRPAALKAAQRGRMRPTPASHLPMTVAYTLKEVKEVAAHAGSFGDDAAAASHVLRVGLEHRAVGEPADQALNPFTTWATRALLADPSLGGLAVAVEEKGIEWDGEDEDHPYASASQIFEIEYWTPEDDPEG